MYYTFSDFSALWSKLLLLHPAAAGFFTILGCEDEHCPQQSNTQAGGAAASVGRRRTNTEQTSRTFPLAFKQFPPTRLLAF